MTNEDKNKRVRIIVTVIGAVGIALFSFMCGFLTSRFTRKKPVSTFEWALKIINEHYYVDVPAEEVTDKSLKGLVGGCLDIYSAYYTADEYAAQKAQNAGNRSGIGVSYTFVGEKDGYPGGKSGILLTRVVGGSPAEKSGFKTGEFVTGYKEDGVATVFETRTDFNAYIDGKEAGEEFTLVTDRGEHTVAKAEYISSYAVMSTSQTTYSFHYESEDGKKLKRVTDEGEGISCLPDGAAYLRLDQFYGNAAAETAELIGKFNAQKCTSLILDLRGNGGGSVDVMCDISGIFTGQLEKRYNSAMSARYKDGSVDVFSVKDKFPAQSQLPQGVKVSVLADNGTASASEALIGVLVDNGIIDYGDVYVSDFSESYLAFSGTKDKNCRTYGKGIMQTTFEHPFTHEALKLTTAKIYWPKGETCIHGVGVGAEQGCKTVPAAWDAVYGDSPLSNAVAMIYG